MIPASGTLVMMSGADLAQLIEQAAERGAARALASAAKQAAAPSLSAKEAAARYAGGSLDRWRCLRHDYPAIDVEASSGEGRLRRWDAQKLEEVMRSLTPKMRRERLARIEAQK